MNKVAIAILVFAMVLMFSATPVLAAAEKRIDGVTATVSGTKMTTIWEKRVTNEGEVRHYTGWIWTGNIVVNIPGEGSISGTFVDTIDGMVFPVITDTDSIEHRQGWGIFHLHEVWTMLGGTFTGTAQMEMTKASFAEYSSRIVLHGTGIYEGWKLVLEKIQGVPYSGYLMKP